MHTATSLLAVLPMRAEAAHRSEQVSQVLFGEGLEVLDQEGDFTSVKTLYDGYEGWVQTSQLTLTDAIPQVRQYTASWSTNITVNGKKRVLPFGVPVVFDGPHGINGFDSYRIDMPDPEPECWPAEGRPFTEKLLHQVVDQYLGTPYLWGGKTVFGIDCSGFVQQVYKLFGVVLLRDAYLQAAQGTAVATVADSVQGDLAFFNNEKGKITHVGLLLGDGTIVHASGQVRIDPIDEEGIIHSDNGKRTHVLHSIRSVNRQ